MAERCLSDTCDRDEIALNGYRIDEVEQSAEISTRPLPPVGETDTVVRELLSIT